MVEKLNVIWMDGRLVKWDDAQVHVLTHSLHYGLGAFEGIRAYATEGGQAVFRLKDHIRRLYDSCQIAGITIPFEFDAICAACKETLTANHLREGYIRPLVFIGEGVMGVYPADNPIRVAIATWKWGKYLGDEALEKGIRAKVSSFTRYHPNTMMTRGKFTGNYTASVLAKREAKQLGYDEAILLDPEGFVAEGSGENIFIIRDGKIKTTPLSVILPGITRDSIMTIAKDLGYDVQEGKFSRDEMYIADEVFFTGTAAEVTPIREIDNRKIGKGLPGPVTKKIQQTYFDAIRGRAKQYASWLDPFELGKASGHPEGKNGKSAAPAKPAKKAKV
jgi:branched-chain amino acid aminotransferase